MGSPAMGTVLRPRTSDQDADDATARLVERFLLKEARLLDEEQYEAWLGLLAPEIRYLMPVPQNGYRKNRGGSTTLTAGMIYDETLATLQPRVARERTGLVWLNDPATRHVRVITNIEAFQTGETDLIEARSNFTVHRSRRERDRTSHVGWREDQLRRTADGLRLVKRVIYLMDRVNIDKNLNMFF